MFSRMADDVDYLAHGPAIKKIMADPSTEVNQSNIMIYLGAIEQVLYRTCDPNNRL